MDCAKACNEFGIVWGFPADSLTYPSLSAQQLWKEKIINTIRVVAVVSSRSILFSAIF